MKPEATNWNDDRLDELSRRTERGFDEVKGEVKELSLRTDKSFDEVKQEVKELSSRTDEGFKDLRQEFNAKFDRLTTALILVGGTLVAAIIGSGILG